MNTTPLKEQKRICCGCGIAYTPTGRNQRYCSTKCLERKRCQDKIELRGWHKSKNRERTCTHCGSHFTAETANQRYCSLACQHNSRYPCLTREITCLHCGKTIVTKSSVKRYCSPKCSERHRGRRSEYDAPTALLCRQCSKQFSPKSTSNVYCTPECKRIAGIKLSSERASKRWRDSREHRERCKEKHREYMRIPKNKERHNERQIANRVGREAKYNSRINAYKAAYRVEVLTHYGLNRTLACNHCGDTNANHLTMDHIHDNGSEERLTTHGTYPLFLRLRNEGYPSGYQTLCGNCQMLKEKERLKRSVCERERTRTDKHNIVCRKKRERRIHRKIELFTYYCNGSSPPKCIVCEAYNIDFLTIDHINGNGIKHRNGLGITGSSRFYDWLWKNKPEGFQVLCFSCQLAKEKENRKTAKPKEAKK